MIIRKSWDDFFTRTDNTLVIAYGTTASAYELYSIKVKPDYFCDALIQEAYVPWPDGSKIKVLKRNEIPAVHVCVFIAVNFRDSQSESETLLNAESYFSNSSTSILVFAQPPENGGVLTNSEGNKIVFDKLAFCLRNLDNIRSVYCDIEHFDESYVYQLFDVNTSMRVINESLVGTNEISGSFVNCVAGKRVTVGQPDVFSNTIHMFGASQIFGTGVEDRHTLSSQLQKLLNRNNLLFKVVNYGIPRTDFAKFYFQVKNTRLVPGDIVMLGANIHAGYHGKKLDVFAGFLKMIHDYCEKNQSKFIFFFLPNVRDIRSHTSWEEYLASFFPDVLESFATINSLTMRLSVQRIITVNPINAFQRPNGYDSLFYDYFHWAGSGNEVLAGQLYNTVNDILLGVDERGMNPDTERELKEYENAFSTSIKSTLIDDGCSYYITSIQRFFKPECKAAGAIVMNCNPFTNGHLYLIEKSASQVEVLYIFILEEDQSAFRFSDRFHLVVENTKHLKNVVVIPGGKYIISSITFPEYFTKDTIQPDSLDLYSDFSAFGANIAPAFNIKTRFVGEEPYCKVTNAYNQQMKKILPEYGIQIREIPRFSVDGDIVSASKVRKMLKDKEYDNVKKYISPITFEYLKSIE